MRKSQLVNSVKLPFSHRKPAFLFPARTTFQYSALLNQGTLTVQILSVRIQDESRHMQIIQHPELPKCGKEATLLHDRAACAKWHGIRRVLIFVDSLLLQYLMPFPM